MQRINVGEVVKSDRPTHEKKTITFVPDLQLRFMLHGLYIYTQINKQVHTRHIYRYKFGKYVDTHNAHIFIQAHTWQICVY